VTPLQDHDGPASITDLTRDGWDDESFYGWPDPADQTCTGGVAVAASDRSDIVGHSSPALAESLVQKIPLRARDGSVRAYALVDDADFEWLSQRRWHLSTEGYVERHESGRLIYMHRLILGLEHGDPRKGDHENRNRLDNRRSNLRIAERGDLDNNQNVGVRADNTAGCRGVSWDKQRRKWKAQVQVTGEIHFLGRFETSAEADAACKAFRAERMPFSDDASRAVR
jgi:hypothetical protein